MRPSTYMHMVFDVPDLLIVHVLLLTHEFYA